MGTLGESKVLWFLALIKGMSGGGEFKISLCYPRGSEASPQSFREGGGVFSSCGVFVDG